MTMRGGPDYIVGSAPRAPRRHHGRAALIVALILALVAGGAGAWWQHSHDGWPFNPASGSYRELGTTGLAVNDDAPETITAIAANPKIKPPFKEVQPLGAVTHVTPDGELGTEITLRFKLDHVVTDPADVLIAYSPSGKPGSWQMKAPTEVSKDGQYAYIKTTHLSYWQATQRAFNEMVDALVAELKKQFNALTSNVYAEAEQPKCKNERLAKEKGYAIGWKKAEVLKFCLGMEGKDNKTPTVRIANQQRFPVFVNHKGINVPERPKSKFGLEMLGRQTFSKDRTVLMPRDELRLTYELSKGQKKSFETEYDGFAEGIYQLEFGLTSLLAILTRFGAGGGIISNGAITMTKFDQFAKYMDIALSGNDCLQSVATDEPNAAEIVKSCFSPSDLADIFGWQGALLGAVMVAGSVVDFFVNSFATLSGLLQGKDRETITVSYNPPQLPKALFVGKWFVHGAFMEIKKDGTGTYTWNAGPCTSSMDETRMCQGNAKLTFKVKGNGKSMTGTYAKVWYTSDGGPAPEDFDGAYEDRMQGMTFTVQRENAHQLLTKDGTGSRPGNPLLCDAYAGARNNTPEFQNCGA